MRTDIGLIGRYIGLQSYRTASVRWDDRGGLGARVGSSHTEPEEVRLEV